MNDLGTAQKNTPRIVSSGIGVLTIIKAINHMAHGLIAKEILIAIPQRDQLCIKLPLTIKATHNFRVRGAWKIGVNAYAKRRAKFIFIRNPNLNGD